MKKILAVVLIICLFFSLSACNNPKGKTSYIVSLSTSKEETSDCNSTVNENDENTSSKSEVSSVDSSTNNDDTENSSTNNNDTDKTNSPSSKPQTPVHKHSFSTATCVKPATCSCGLIKGGTVGHTWIDASCAAPKTCSVCKVTEGSTKDHLFVDKKCYYCGESKPLTELEKFENELSSKFKQVDIGIDTWKLFFEVSANTRDIFRYDFWIQVNWETVNVSPYDLEHSILYTQQQKDFAISKLKNVQMEIFEYVIAKYPTKKFQGGFYHSWYKYPSIREGLTSIRFLTWKNFEDEIGHDYYQAKQTDFYWDNYIDDYKF